jgi:hypothetical protein
LTRRGRVRGEGGGPGGQQPYHRRLTPPTCGPVHKTHEPVFCVGDPATVTTHARPDPRTPSQQVWAGDNNMHTRSVAESTQQYLPQKLCSTANKQWHSRGSRKKQKKQKKQKNKNNSACLSSTQVGASSQVTSCQRDTCMHPPRQEPCPSTH